MEAIQTPVQITSDAMKNKENNQESSVEVRDYKTSPENSEYDSAGSYSNDEDNSAVKARSRGSDLDSHSEAEGSVILEREEGDGQESVPTKKIDDDEDKKNPQYIPKRGTFYEHDDRTADDVESVEKAEVEKSEKENKKKVWQDKKERWSHDRFNDSEQAPKSRTELIAIYGYDIRNEEGPPRARRRRRYGRGPNKYTRNWEDEDAYNKVPIVNNKVKKPPRPKRTQNTEEFPPLNRSEFKSPPRNEHYNNVVEENERNHRQSSERSETNTENITNISQAPAHKPPVSSVSVMPSNVQESANRNTDVRSGIGRNPKPKKEIKDSDYRGFTTKTRQQRNIKSEQQKVLPPHNQNKEEFIQSQNFTNKTNNVQEVERDMSNLNIQDGVYKGGKHTNNNQNRQGSVPPRLQSEQKGSKRYSSMRQRSLPETSTPPAPNFPPSFYPSDYNSQAPPPATQTPILHPNAPIHPAPAQLPPPLPPMPQQVPVTAAPLLQPQFPAPFPQPPPTFLQAGVAPPAFIPAQPPQIINYVQSQPTFPPPNYQGYQQQFNPVTQPAELYQPQGGITYYSTDQQVLARPVPQKRPKAAIPIVAPNDLKEKDQKENENIKLQDSSTMIYNEYNTEEGFDLQE